MGVLNSGQPVSYNTYKDIYDRKLQDYFNLLKNGSLKDLNHEVTLKLHDKNLEITYKYFILNFVLLEPFIKEDYEITSDILLLSFNKKKLMQAVNKIINYLRAQDLPMPKIKRYLGNIMENLTMISIYMNNRVGNTINLITLSKLYNSNEEFKDLVHYQIDESLPIHDSELLLAKHTKKLLKLLKDHSISITNMLNCDISIREKQLRETIMNIGYKPDLIGNIIPKPINSNFILGLNDKEDFYNNSIGARKALITNSRGVKVAGYLTRKLLLLMFDINLSEVEDCETNHYLEITVKDDDHLAMLIGKNYLRQDDQDELYLDTVTEDSIDLIGETIYTRSPITCALKDGKICKTCFSELLYDAVYGNHIGIIATLLLTSKFTQTLLSTKHLLNVKTEEITWSDKFTDLFVIDQNSIRAKEGLKFKIKIESDDIEEEDGKLVFKEFTIISHTEATAKLLSPVHLVIPKKYYRVLDEEVQITIDSMAQDAFYFIVENVEFSKTLRDIIRILDTNTHQLEKGEDITYHNVYKRFIGSLLSSQIFINSTYVELILKRLLRDDIDNTQNLDFSVEEIKNYSILSLTNAIIQSPSPALGLSFERVKKQLMTPEFYIKDGVSLADKLFN